MTHDTPALRLLVGRWSTPSSPSKTLSGAPSTPTTTCSCDTRHVGRREGGGGLVVRSKAGLVLVQSSDFRSSLRLFFFRVHPALCPEQKHTPSLSAAACLFAPLCVHATVLPGVETRRAGCMHSRASSQALASIPGHGKSAFTLKTTAAFFFLFFCLLTTISTA